MSLVKVVVRDGKQFNVSKITLEQCAYFKTLFSTTVGKDGASSTVFASCDGESFALLVRLLTYGVESVPNDSVECHLVWILFHDANYLGVPSKLLRHLTYSEPLKQRSMADVCFGNIRCFFLPLPTMHIFIESATLKITNRDFVDKFSLGRFHYIKAIDDNGINVRDWPCNKSENYATEHELQLDFLNGDCPTDKWRGLTIEFDARTNMSFQLTLLFRIAKSYEEFCATLIAK